MKKEIKELVEFIKDCIFRHQTELKRGEVDVGMIDGEEEDKTCNKAITFLDSLPEIESHLCRGGYIQDKNGTPCCEGDEVIYTEPSLPIAVRGVLNWNKNSGCFKIRHSMGTILGPLNISRLEKVK